MARQRLSHPQLQQSRPATARCFPLPPQSRPESQPDPAGSTDPPRGRFAASEIAAPAPPIRGQCLPRRLPADAFCPWGNLPDSLLKPSQGLGRHHTLPLRTGRNAAPKKLPLLRSCHRALRLIPLELELLPEEWRDALPHPLPRPLAANVEMTIVRLSNEARTPALYLPVELVEHEVTEQGRKWSPLRSSFHARADPPVLPHPGMPECPDEFPQPLVLDPFGNLPHQLVVRDPLAPCFRFLSIDAHIGDTLPADPTSRR